MPKLNRWITAKKTCPVFSPDLVKAITDLGGNLAGGNFEMKQVVNVNTSNHEKIIKLLEQNGYEVVNGDEG